MRVFARAKESFAFVPHPLRRHSTGKPCLMRRIPKVKLAVQEFAVFFSFTICRPVSKSSSFMSRFLAPNGYLIVAACILDSGKFLALDSSYMRLGTAVVASRSLLNSVRSPMHSPSPVFVYDPFAHLPMNIHYAFFPCCSCLGTERVFGTQRWPWDCRRSHARCDNSSMAK